MPQVAFEFNEDGIRTKENRKWCRQSVNKVLSNELYTGSYEVADYSEHVEAYRIISDMIFETTTETRHRFRPDRVKMDSKRKQSKADRILNAYRQSVGETGP